jgi:hypothetical protein
MRRLLLLPPLAVFVLATSGFREPLTWPEPPLAAGARVIRVPTSGGVWWGMPATQDCDVRLPPAPVTDTVKVDGCRNVRIVGGAFASQADPCSAVAAGANESPAVYVNDFAGTAHVEGLRIRGPGFSDGIWMTSERPGSVGQVEGNWIGGLAACSEPVPFGATWVQEHPDCFQTWTGPRVLRFDKNTCWTPYQGINVDTASLPGPSGARAPARAIDIRRTNVRLDERSPNGRACFMVWHPESPPPTNLERVHCAPGIRDYRVAFAPRVDLSPGAWGKVIPGVPAAGDEVRPAEAGIGYARVSAPARPRVGQDRPAGRAAWLDRDSAKRLVKKPRRLFGLRRTLARGLLVRVRCLAACRVTASLLLDRRAGRALRVGGGHGRIRSAGEKAVAVDFGKRARRRLRRAHKIGLTLRVVIVAGPDRGSVSRQITLRRR